MSPQRPHEESYLLVQYQLTMPSF